MWEKEIWMKQMGILLRQILNHIEQEQTDKAPRVTRCATPESAGSLESQHDTEKEGFTKDTMQGALSSSDLPEDFVQDCNFCVQTFVDRINYHLAKDDSESADFRDVPESLAGGSTQGPPSEIWIYHPALFLYLSACH